MRNLSSTEIEQVSGGLGPETGGVAIIALGASATLATGLFGLAVGGALLYLAFKSR